MNSLRNTLLLAAAVLLLGAAVPAPAQHEPPSAPAQGPLLPDDIRQQISRLIVQDFQGRMKPLDTLAREMVMKVTKHSRFQGWRPLDLYLSWLTNPELWWHQPVIAVRNQGLRELLGVPAGQTHIAAASLYDESGQYRLADLVDEAMRTPDKSRTKVQRKLLSFDERFNLFYMTMRGGTLRIYPVPEDPNHTWLAAREVLERLEPPLKDEYQQAFLNLMEGIRERDMSRVRLGIDATRAIQEEYGADVIPSPTALNAELFLNRTAPFVRVMVVYLAAFLVLMTAFFWNLARHKGQPYRWRHPLYLLGNLLFWAALAIHLGAFVMRWIAAGRAPLSNGYESLLFISLAVGLAGFIFEFSHRRGATAGLSALLTATILGISMMSTFDPAIGPLVPVLVSYWLNIHVTVITASYGFLGLAALLGALVLILHFRKGPGRTEVYEAVQRLDRLNAKVVLAGLALLSVGTLLGGVWANESWGRYWGWDSKETWSLVTIVVYAIVLHFRWVPSLKRPWLFAATSFAAVASVVMTYFGVNYFLAGLHSYAAGEAATVPPWVKIGALLMLGLILASWWFEQSRNWNGVPPSGSDRELKA
jgi:cytochrome c-type biogenesis protein CcsB